MRHYTCLSKKSRHSGFSPLKKRPEFEFTVRDSLCLCLVRELQIKQRRSNTGIPTTSRWGSKPCNIMNCMACHLISDCSNITSTVTQKTFGIMGDIDCSSLNRYYLIDMPQTGISRVPHRMLETDTPWLYH